MGWGWGKQAPRAGGSPSKYVGSRLGVNPPPWMSVPMGPTPISGSPWLPFLAGRGCGGRNNCPRDPQDCPKGPREVAGVHRGSLGVARAPAMGTMSRVPWGRGPGGLGWHLGPPPGTWQGGVTMAAGHPWWHQGHILRCPRHPNTQEDEEGQGPCAHPPAFLPQTPPLEAQLAKHQTSNLRVWGSWVLPPPLFWGAGSPGGDQVVPQLPPESR